VLFRSHNAEQFQQTQQERPQAETREPITEENITPSRTLINEPKNKISLSQNISIEQVDNSENIGNHPESLTDQTNTIVQVSNKDNYIKTTAQPQEKQLLVTEQASAEPSVRPKNIIAKTNPNVATSYSTAKKIENPYKQTPKRSSSLDRGSKRNSSSLNLQMYESGSEMDDDQWSKSYKSNPKKKKTSSPKQVSKHNSSQPSKTELYNSSTRRYDPIPVVDTQSSRKPPERNKNLSGSGGAISKNFRI
jgi:hypothetical protein